MTVIIDRTTAERPPARSARVSMAPGGSAPGPLDGAWWPHSRDIALELPLLVAAFEAQWGTITRVAVNPTHWPVVPKKVALDGRVVRVGWFHTGQDPHTLLVLSRRVSRWDLLVIPPEASPAVADRLMAAAADPRNTLRSGALMAEAGAVRAVADADRAGETDWEAEGGHGTGAPVA